MYETVKAKIETMLAGKMYDLARCYDTYRLSSIVNSLREDLDTIGCELDQMVKELEKGE